MTIWPVAVLRDPSTPLVPYLAAAFVAATGPALLISLSLPIFFSEDQLQAVTSHVFSNGSLQPVSVLTLILFIPIVETFLMVVLFGLLRSWKLSVLHQSVAQAAVWGSFHGSIALPWALPTAWLFFVFSVVYTTRLNNGGAEAFAVTSAVHG
ncbi:MAG: hypothetical protein AAGG79_02490, partial [Pseudomonadota bacterium]